MPDTHPHSLVDETQFLVVDVETTGLDPRRGDRVCEIAAVQLRCGAVIEQFSTYVDPCRDISPGAFSVNQITKKMLAGAPKFLEITDKLQEMMNGSVMVGYNAGFDLSFLNSEFRLAGHMPHSGPVVDVLPLARQIFPGLQRYKQEEVALVAGIPFPVKHRALEDTLVTAQLFVLFSSVLKSHGMERLSDLCRNDLPRALAEKKMPLIGKALAEGDDLWIRYFSPMSGQITERVITPRTIFPPHSGKSGHDLLLAFCHSSREERNFRIDRILDLRPVKKAKV